MYLKHVNVNHNIHCAFDCFGWEVYVRAPKNNAPKEDHVHEGIVPIMGEAADTDQKRYDYFNNVYEVLKDIERRIGSCKMSDRLKDMIATAAANLARY